jgi:hypothetical protein
VEKKQQSPLQSRFTATMSTDNDSNKKISISTLHATASFHGSSNSIASGSGVVGNGLHNESIGNSGTSSGTKSSTSGSFSSVDNANTNTNTALSATSLPEQNSNDGGGTLRVRNTSSNGNANANKNNQSTILGNLYIDPTLRMPGKSYESCCPISQEIIGLVVANSRALFLSASCLRPIALFLHSCRNERPSPFSAHKYSRICPRPYLNEDD